MTEDLLTDYMLIDNLAALVDIQPEGIVSRTFYKGDRVKALVFGFDAGQELTEHTSSQAAIIHIIQGKATVTLNDDIYELSEGGWVHMPPKLSHGIRAKTPVIMLLTMLGAE